MPNLHFLESVHQYAKELDLTCSFALNHLHEQTFILSKMKTKSGLLSPKKNSISQFPNIPYYHMPKHHPMISFRSSLKASANNTKNGSCWSCAIRETPNHVEIADQSVTVKGHWARRWSPLSSKVSHNTQIKLQFTSRTFLWNKFLLVGNLSNINCQEKAITLSGVEIHHNNLKAFASVSCREEILVALSTKKELADFTL